MMPSRRSVLRLAAGAAALPLLPQSASSQAWPSRPMRMLVGFPAGNAPDIVARLIAQSLTEGLGQPVVVENRPGAASNIATAEVIRSAPDGYTMQMTVLTNVFNTTLYRNLNFSFVTDMAHIAGVANAPFVLVVPPSLPVKSVAEFVAHAKATPGKLNMGSGGQGSATHIFGELFKAMAGVDLLHVPYRGPYMPDLISGQIQMVVAPIPQALPLVRDGKLRALGVTTAKRLASLPDVPTVAETVKGYEAIGWYGLGVPKGVPADIAGRINAAINKALADPKVVARLAGMGIEPMPMTPAGFGKFVESEAVKWTKVIKDAGAVAE
ncbi:MAG: tripartite tricarboxylate transporter substrate binding protein [Alphaproteobacteria bacterium]|nr:tripartite tricarboxylate transporter substrate binding protein [Alphaproteobacteria bacterium]